MAIKNVTNDLAKLIENNVDLQDQIRKNMGLNDYHSIEITADESAAAFQRGTQRMLIKVGYSRSDIHLINKKHNNLDSWKVLIARMFLELSAGPVVERHGFKNLVVIEKLGTPTRVLASRGLYLQRQGSNSRRIIIRLFNMKKAQKHSNVDDVTLEGFAKAFRNYAYDKWRLSLPDSLKTLSSGGKSLSGTKRKDYGAAASQQFGIRTPFVHDAGSEVGTRVLEGIHKDVKLYSEGVEFSLLGVSGIYESVVTKLIAALKVDYEDKMVPTENGGIKYARIVRGKIGGVNFAGSSPGDVKRISSELMTEVGDYLTKHAKDFGFDADSGLDYETSKPVRRVIAENAKNKIVTGVTKQLLKKPSKNKKVKAKVRSKAAKNSSRKETIKRPKKVKSRAIRTALLVKGKSVKRVEQQKQEKAAGLLKLRTLIQKRLPAEVRRNMGRPALINRTGEFSNSAELVNLRRTKMGISGEYTYKLNPYATFESLGTREWPAGYNPKPLIAKSIRNLAMQYTDDRIVSLRRI